MSNNLEFSVFRIYITLNTLFYIIFYKIKHYDFQFVFAVFLVIIILITNIIKISRVKKYELKHNNVEFISRIISSLFKIMFLTILLNWPISAFFHNNSNAVIILFIEILFLFFILIITFFERPILRIICLIFCLFLTFLIFGNSINDSKEYTKATLIIIVIFTIIVSVNEKK